MKCLQTDERGNDHVQRGIHNVFAPRGRLHRRQTTKIAAVHGDYFDSKIKHHYTRERTRRQVTAGRDDCSLECYLIGLPQANCIPKRGMSLPVKDSSSLLDADVSSDIIASPPASWGL